MSTNDADQSRHRLHFFAVDGKDGVASREACDFSGTAGQYLRDDDPLHGLRQPQVIQRILLRFAAKTAQIKINGSLVAGIVRERYGHRLFTHPTHEFKSKVIAGHHGLLCNGIDRGSGFNACGRSLRLGHGFP